MKPPTVFFRAIDIGSNAVRVKTWRIAGDSQPSVADFQRLPIRLGTSVFSSGRLDDEAAVAKLAVFLRDSKRALDRGAIHAVRAVATSALRDATNGPEICAHLKEQTGIEVRILGGEEEARMTSLGALGREADPAKDYVLIDIGGGSTETIRTRGTKVLEARSMRLGAVRLVRSCWPGSEIPSAAQIQSAKSLIAETLDADPKIALLPSGAEGIGLAGTIQTLGRMQQTATNTLSSALSIDWLSSTILRLCIMPPVQIAAEFKIEPDRAEVILAGAIICQAVMQRLALGHLRIVASGVADGLLAEFLAERAAQS